MVLTKESLYRALRTFIQTAIGYFVVNIALIDFSNSKTVVKSALIGLAVSSASAGLSAVMNLEFKGSDNDDI